jgi:hypothetical protein
VLPPTSGIRVKITVYCGVTSYSLVKLYRCTEELIVCIFRIALEDAEDEGNTFLRNVGELPDSPISNSRRQYC